MPYHITGHVDETDQRPCSHFIGGNPVYNYGLSLNHHGVACVTRIGCFTCIIRIIGFNYIVLSIQVLIANKLYPYLVIGFALHIEDSHILVFAGIDTHLQYDYMQIFFGVIEYPYIIDPVITVQIQIVDPGILVVQAPFKILKGFRFLKEFHHCKEVQVVTWQSQISVSIILCI
jgi:hypothetical protein